MISNTSKPKVLYMTYDILDMTLDTLEIIYDKKYT